MSLNRTGGGALSVGIAFVGGAIDKAIPVEWLLVSGGGADDWLCVSLPLLAFGLCYIPRVRSLLRKDCCIL